MGRWTVPVCAVALAGCAQIFGIDNTSGPPDAALPPMATLTIERLSIGASLERNPFDLTGLSAAYYIEDAAETSGLRRIPATAAGNVFSAELPDGVPASVESTVADPNPWKRLFAFPNRDLKISHAVYEHPGTQPAPAGGTFAVSLTLPTGYASGELIRLFAVGPWVYRDLAAGELPAPDTAVTAVGPVTIDYDSTQFRTTLGGVRPLQKVTTADRVVALRYVGSDLTAAGEVAAFEQTGGTDAISATLVEVAHAPLDVTVAPSANATRLAMTTPAGTSLALNWTVVAAPAWQFANANGIQLNAGALAQSDPGSITAGYGNPFEAYGWNAMFVWNPSRARSFTPPALALPVTLYTGVQHYLVPAAGATVDVQAGLPVLVSVNDQPLTSDGLTITIDPNKSVTLSMVSDRTSNTYYQYNVHELVPNAAMPPTALEFRLVYAALSPASEIRVPAGVFTTSKVYSVRAHCFSGGYSSLQTGDFTNRDLPLTVGYFDSGVFTVAAP